MKSSNNTSQALEPELLVAILSAAASVALGEKIKILSINNTNNESYESEFPQFQGWCHHTRTQQFLLSNTIR